MKVNFSGELRSVGIVNFNKRDGSVGQSYPVLIEVGEESYTFDADDVAIYNDFVQGKLHKGDMCQFDAEYNPKFRFNNFKIVGVKVIQKISKSRF